MTATVRLASLEIDSRMNKSTMCIVDLVDGAPKVPESLENDIREFKNIVESEIAAREEGLGDEDQVLNKMDEGGSSSPVKSDLLFSQRSRRYDQMFQQLHSRWDMMPSISLSILRFTWATTALVRS